MHIPVNLLKPTELYTLENLKTMLWSLSEYVIDKLIVLVCLGLRRFLGCRMFTAKSGKVQANQDDLVTLVLLRQGLEMTMKIGPVHI